MQKTETNRWLVLVIVCLAQFMVVLDATVVNIALPSIQRGLSFSDADLQWVINAYTLVFGGFLLLGGRAADLLGRKRLFLAGVALFSAASLLNGLAQSSSMLIAGRALQGLGGALVSPAALSILMTSFPGTRERTKALGVWSAIVTAQEYGWGSGRTLGMLGVSAALLAAFVAIERRSAAPLVRLNMFRSRTMSAANVAMMLVASGMFSMFFFASLYVQEVLGYSPLKAGLAFLPVTLGMMAGAAVAQGAIRRFGPRGVGVVGVSLAALGMLWLTGLPVHGSYVSDLLAGLLPMSVGMGLTFVPVTLLATAGVAAEDSGLASGLINTSQQVGGALGLAILSTLSANHATSALADGASRPEALLAGWHVGFTGGAIVLVLAAFTLVVGLRQRDLEQINVDAAVPVAA